MPPRQLVALGRSNSNALHFVQGNLVLSPAVKFGGPWRLVVGEVLGDFAPAVWIF